MKEFSFSFLQKFQLCGVSQDEMALNLYAKGSKVGANGH